MFYPCYVYIISYDPCIRAEIGKYASVHGVAAASRVYSKKLKQRVGPATVRSIMQAYIKELKKKRAAGVSQINQLPLQKHGRPLLFGKNRDRMLQAYLRKVREAGAVVSSRIVIPAAKGLMMTLDQAKLTEFGGYMSFSKSWAHSLLHRMGYVQRKATTSKSKMTEANFSDLKQSFLSNLRDIVIMDEVPLELVLNWDQTGIKIVPIDTWTMDVRGSKRVELIGLKDKQQITAVFCGTLVGDFLPVQLVYKGKTNQCHPHFAFPIDWEITHSPKHWSTEATMISYIDNIIGPYVERTRQVFGHDSPAIIIMDNFKGQITPAIFQQLEAYNIHHCLLPANTTDRLQLMDLTVNKPIKYFLKQKFGDWYSSEVMKQLQGKDLETVELEPISLNLPCLKELGAQWLVEAAKYMSANPQMTVNGFVKAGISTFLSAEEDTIDVQESNDEYIVMDSDSEEALSDESDECAA